MAYQVLARKWRPKTFADLVGQEHVVKALRNALEKGRLHHAYLLTGTRGVGKTTIARILAKSLNCEHPKEGEPCGQCQSCRDIDTGRFVDLLEIDAASNTGIDNIREVLENAQYAPTAGKYKVYIIDEVHMLSKSAFNAMLKTLEEPPEHVKFILATTDPHKVPVTVLSRCLQFVLRNMTAQQVSQHLAHVLDSEQIPYEAPALALLGRAAAGSMRDALSLLDQAIAMGSGKVAEQDVRQMIGAVDKRYLYELLQSIAGQNGAALMNQARGNGRTRRRLRQRPERTRPPAATHRPAANRTRRRTRRRPRIPRPQTPGGTTGRRTNPALLPMRHPRQTRPRPRPRRIRRLRHDPPAHAGLRPLGRPAAAHRRANRRQRAAHPVRSPRKANAV